MFLEAGFFRRPKQGVYQFEKTNQPYQEVTVKIYIESFNVNQPLSPTNIDKLNPYFQFITLRKYKLSKSTFIRGLQCEKSLYLYKHHYKLKDPTPESLQAVFEQGTNIGLLAQNYLPMVLMLLQKIILRWLNRLEKH